MKELISIIVPCFNEEEVLPYFFKKIENIEEKMSYVNFEYILVNDGSKDKTLDILKQYSKNKLNVKYISFSRNFGKEAAIYAGLKNAKGNYIVMMDADLQDPPSLLPEMYRIIKEEDYDSVATRRVNRKGEPKIRSFFARMFYKVINRISSAEIVDGARDYRLMSRIFVDSLLQMKEYNRFSKGLFGWVGYKTKWIEFENVERAAGETKWSFWKLFRYSLEGIVAFSTMPLAIASLFGILMCGCSVIAIIIIITRQLIYENSAFGWSSMVCIMIFLGGIQLLSIGILGMYLSKTYLEVKKRPLYIVKETNVKSE